MPMAPERSPESGGSACDKSVPVRRFYARASEQIAETVILDLPFGAAFAPGRAFEQPFESCHALAQTDETPMQIPYEAENGRIEVDHNCRFARDRNFDSP